MKSKEEINDLKSSWLSYPIWDIENTEGFEDHKKELLEYRHTVEEEARLVEEKRVSRACALYGCNKELLALIERMQFRIELLERGKET